MNENPSLTTFAAQQAARRQNERRFEVFCNLLSARVERDTRTVRPEGVYVMVSGLDALAAWMDAAGGVLHRGPEFEGTQIWTLYTQSAGWDDGRSVVVQVSAVGVVGELHILDHEVSVDAGRVVRPLAEMPQAVAS